MAEITEERRSRFAAEITDSDVDDDVRELLVKYSDIPADQVTKHLIDIVRTYSLTSVWITADIVQRGRAWAIVRLLVRPTAPCSALTSTSSHTGA